MTEVQEFISPGSNFSRLLTLPLVFTIIHNMPKKFIQDCKNGSFPFLQGAGAEMAGVRCWKQNWGAVRQDYCFDHCKKVGRNETKR